MFRLLVVAVCALCLTSTLWAQPPSDRELLTPAEMRARVLVELQKKWPKNRLVRVVCHGHSVPAGYFKTPEVRRHDSYPLLFHKQLCERFQTAPIDVCVTAIGGEKSDAGAERFERDVLSLKPDVVTIDYSLNDRGLGLEKAEVAWRAMIEASLERNILVIVLTPTPDSGESLTDPEAPLAKHAAQVRRLADEYKIPLVDSYAAFQQRVAAGESIESLLSQRNHPNRVGHDIVAELLLAQFVITRPGE